MWPAVFCDSKGARSLQLRLRRGEIEAGRKYYPAEALTSFAAFQSFTADLSAKILSEAFADPVHAAFPKTLVGNYGSAVSSEAYPEVDGNLAPIRQPVSGG